MGAATIESGDEACWTMIFAGRKGREDVGEIVRADADVGVVDDEVIVVRVRQELREVADLTVRTEDLRAMNKLDSLVRIIARSWRTTGTAGSSRLETPKRISYAPE